MTRKGGGRESGGAGRGERVKEGTNEAQADPSNPRPPSLAAAKPAVLHPCPDCDPLHEQYRERIRALEAELAAARKEAGL